MTKIITPAVVRAFEGLFHAAQKAGPNRWLWEHPEAMGWLKTVAECRKRQWASTNRLHALVEETGLIGELAAWLSNGNAVNEAWAQFLAGLVGTDGGDDMRCHWDGQAADVKTTSSPALRFRFSRNNRHRLNASRFVFVQAMGLAEPSSPMSLQARVLGWADRRELQPHMTPGGHAYEVLHLQWRLPLLHPFPQQEKGGGNDAA